jgi:hypothetical protein
LTVTSAASGTGNGTVAFVAAANTAAARTGTLTIAGQPLRCRRPRRRHHRRARSRSRRRLRPSRTPARRARSR